MDRNTKIPLVIGASILAALVLTRRKASPGGPDEPVEVFPGETNFDPDAPRPGRPTGGGRPPRSPGNRPPVLNLARPTARFVFDQWLSRNRTGELGARFNAAVNRDIAQNRIQPQSRNCREGGCWIYREPVVRPAGNNIAHVNENEAIELLFERNGVFAPDALTGRPANWAYIEYRNPQNATARGWIPRDNAT